MGRRSTLGEYDLEQAEAERVSRWAAYPDHDPSLLAGLDADLADRWRDYLFARPMEKGRVPNLKTRALALYDPFATRDRFGAGLRYCLNTYAGCGFGCLYCYTRNYIVDSDRPREKKDLLRLLRRDLGEVSRLGLPPTPLHLSNSTDPFQHLERERGKTRAVLELVAAHRAQFTTITIITKSPDFAAEPDYLQQLCNLHLDQDRPCQVEVSLTFSSDEKRKLYEPGAPSVEERMAGIEALTAAGLPVSLRIDPLFPREPLPSEWWDEPRLDHFGVSGTHTLDEIKQLLGFASRVGCQKVIVSPLKLPSGRRTPRGSDTKLYRGLRRLYTELKGGPIWRGFSLRLPDRYVGEVLIAQVRRLGADEGLPVVFCKHNLINTR
jgi:DNA repair photolyase